MVGIEPKLNTNLEQKIQEWLFQSWIPKEPDLNYREVLTRVIRTLWPDHGEKLDEGRSPSYLPLPGLCSYALGQSASLTTQVNAAWVLLYLSSYLLDKVEDQETEHPIFSLFDQSTVVNITTGLLLHAQRILCESELSQDQDLFLLDNIRRKFNRMALEVCAGQHADLTLKEPTFSQSWEIVHAKSGKFFSLGAYLGASLATGDTATVEAFSQFGTYLGIIVQIANDLRGIGMDDDRGSDLARGKRTLPIQFTLEVLPRDDRLKLIRLIHAAQEDHIAEIEARSIIVSAGAVVYLSLEAQKNRQLAINVLNNLYLDTKATSPLFDLLDYASHHRKRNPKLC